MYLSIKQLSERWQCGPSTARRVLVRNGAHVVDFAQRGCKGKKLVPLKVVEQIEIRRTKRLT